MTWNLTNRGMRCHTPLLAKALIRTAVQDIMTEDIEQSDALSCFQLSPISLLQRINEVFATASSLNVINRVPNYVWCAMLMSVGGLVWGFDTGSIGPISIMPQFAQQFSSIGVGLSPTVQGLIISSILLTASIASVVSGPIADRISRTRTTTLGAAVFAAGSAITCSANTSLVQIFVGRCIAGVGEGLFMSALTVYTIEIAPASRRGQLTTIIQLMITIGIASGLCSKWNSQKCMILT